MPAGKNKQQTARHDGGKSRICVYCGKVGARSRNHNHQLAHRRCIPKQQPKFTPRELSEQFEGEAFLGPAVTSRTSIHHHKTAKFGLNKEPK